MDLALHSIPRYTCEHEAFGAASGMSIVFEIHVKMCEIMTNLSTILGWWNIGVELTLSPFHTAKAFDAPILRGVNFAAGSPGIINEIGDTRLQLGAVDVQGFENHVIDLRARQQDVNRSRIGIDTLDQTRQAL